MRHILLAAALLVLPATDADNEDRPIDVLADLRVAARCEAVTKTVITLSEISTAMALMMDLRTDGERDVAERLATMLAGATDEIRGWHDAVTAKRRALTNEAIAMRLRHTDAEVDALRAQALAGFWRSLLEAAGDHEKLAAAISGIGLEAEECEEWAR